MARSFVKLMQVNPGFNQDRLLTMRLTPNFSRYQTRTQLLVLSRNILRRVGEVPGVQSRALASNFPFSRVGVVSGPGWTPFQIEGKPQSKGALAPAVDITIVSWAYFQTIHQPILSGRDFTEHDEFKSPSVAIINQTMAHHRWPAEDPIGTQISFDGGDHWIKVVGIAGDTKEYGLSQPVNDEVYLPDEQAGFTGNLVVRTSADPTTFSLLIRKALHDIDPQLAIDQVATVESLEQEWAASPRVITILLGLFAMLALAISATGIGAVMALSVNQRTRELGVRMALGASQPSVVRMIVGNGFRLALAGTIVGIAGAVALTPLMSSLLYHRPE